MNKLIYIIFTARAYKDCTANGSWYVDPETNKTWTDYTDCVPLEVCKLIKIERFNVCLFPI